MVQLVKPEAQVTLDKARTAVELAKFAAEQVWIFYGQACDALALARTELEQAWDAYDGYALKKEV